MNEAKILSVVKNGGVFDLSADDFKGRRMTVAEVIAIFDEFDAFWEYQGDPCADRPHALLKSKMHSNGFINCRAVLDYTKLCMLLAHEMLKAIEEKMTHEAINEIGGVACSAYSAIDIGCCLTLLLSQKYDPQVKHIIVEKDDDGDPTVIRGGINPKMTVLIINELMTTKYGSTYETKKAVLECNGDNSAPKVIDMSFVLMHRSTSFELEDGSEVVPVFHFDIANFDVPKGEDCPFCDGGSEAIPPKKDNNWNILHGKA